ncbi:Uncharacterised protein [uncultured archaeon]|nr:Uncharacterised protein [uncultured archaeon]
MAEEMPAAKIASLINGMLSPKSGERMLFLTDYSSKPSTRAHGRQLLLARWHKAASLLAEQKGFRVLPIVRYAETGKNNADLPRTAVTHDGGHIDSLSELIASSNIVIAMTEYSASAPLKLIASRAPSLRVVSMPGVTADMEPAMAADYASIEARGKKLLAIVSSATGFEITFDGAGLPRNTKLFIDTRASNWLLDAGACRSPGDFINFPSGELFTPPYEGVSEAGRRELGDSKTSGVWPVYSPKDGKIAFLHVEKNRITRVQGDSAIAKRIIEDIAQDENNANIAELGLGLNEKARSGAEIPILESEKSGPHIAYGRDDHFGNGGIVGVVKASVHQDFVYAKDSPITATIYAVYANGNRVLIAERGKIVV